MRKLIYLLVALQCAACSKSDDNQPALSNAPSKEIGKDFAARFPNIEEVTWRVGFEGYHVATFTAPAGRLKSNTKNSVTEAWYILSGSCDLVERDLTIDDLPQAIRQAWESSDEHAEGYTIYDIDCIARDETPLVKIETEYHSGTYRDGCDFYFLASGKLLFKNVRMDLAEENKNTENRPVPTLMREYLSATYPGAIITDLEEAIDTPPLYLVTLVWKDNLYTAEFVADTKHFRCEYSEWSFTQLPAALQTALRSISAEASDANTSAERVRYEPDVSPIPLVFHIDSDIPGLSGLQFDEKGNRL